MTPGERFALMTCSFSADDVDEALARNPPSPAMQKFLDDFASAPPITFTAKFDPPPFDQERN